VIRRPAILIVENDRAIREGVALTLHQFGCDAILVESGSGEEALVLMTELDQLDGLYTDIELNDGVSGWKIGARFHVVWPDKRVVYASGAHTQPARLLDNEVFLRKPFEGQALWEALQLA
jgi:CheY-like chemotaxis protein